ncbi:hypothetical protein GDO86_004422 [Hymenochirus boettgeri]|uniref:Protein endoU n=1 Tax=Hymenochirus boettgeri TaxID=247094 RepID=A0A8T2K7S7_9PIPI|nr:hypothetical protein GDO86_004422 [Hymenochirus boettgeri]
MTDLHLLLILSLSTAIVASVPCPGNSCKDSCKNRCGDKASKNFKCQCNERCETFKDCCDDYHMCFYADPSTKDSAQQMIPVDSCQGRCGETYNKKNVCQCNFKCNNYNNCCNDFDETCTGTSSNQVFQESGNKGKHRVDISNEEIKEMSEKMYKLDFNKAEQLDIILNIQEKAQNTGAKKDLADKPLYKFVNEKIFKRPTYAAFIELLDNYDRKTGIDETYSPAEIKEQENFVLEIMKTKLMKELFKFFQSKGLYKTENEFAKDMIKMWFGLYTRSSGFDSSGFEHVFVGEVKKGIVSGFHSWIRFYLLENKGMLNYYSYNYNGPWTTYPDVLGKQFYWDQYYKEVGGQFIGSSPEFDFGLYTLCFISRPGKKCNISLDKHEMFIQTYEWTKSTYDNGKKYIATAYPST